jgi:hypothetical protein
MAYKLRFVQKFEKANQSSFLKIERLFIELEKSMPDFPIGKRFLPVTGKESTNTLIWEADFEDLEKAVDALQVIESNSMHEKLLAQQIEFMLDTYTEIYKEFN